MLSRRLVGSVGVFECVERGLAIRSTFRESGIGAWKQDPSPLLPCKRAPTPSLLSLFPISSLTLALPSVSLSLYLPLSLPLALGLFNVLS